MQGILKDLQAAGCPLNQKGVEELLAKFEMRLPSTPKEIAELIKRALDLDWRTKGTTSSLLPMNLLSTKKASLKGPLLLQVSHVSNAGQPTISQDQGERMLRLGMTDGVTSLLAVEHRPSKQLGLQLQPGTKLRLLGSIDVRNGIILLQQSNHELAGGEVEELREKWEMQQVGSNL